MTDNDHDEIPDWIKYLLYSLAALIIVLFVVCNLYQKVALKSPRMKPNIHELGTNAELGFVSDDAYAAVAKYEATRRKQRRQNEDYDANPDGLWSNDGKDLTL
tara:strand:- start:190 stop:498 length:309 start_codon:yes stop_codon:yes gene_type:complete